MKLGPESVVVFIKKNIHDENKADEIFQLVERGDINPNDNLFYNNNLLHFAATNANLKLAKKLIANSLTDVNQKNSDGSPLLCELAQRYSPKLDGMIDYLLEETNIDVRAVNSWGITASTLAEGLKRIALMQRILKYEPPNVPASQMYNIKMTCHRFGLSGKLYIRETTLPDEFKEIDAEGYEVNVTIPQLQVSFNAFLNQPQIEDYLSLDEIIIMSSVNDAIQNNSVYDVSSDLGYSFDVVMQKQSEAYQMFLDGKMVAIHGVDHAHVASVVLQGNTLYRCNKGLGKHPEYSIVEYKINTKQGDCPIPGLRETQFTALFNTIAPQDIIDLEEQGGLKAKEQYVGNCTYASPKQSVRAMIYHTVLQRFPNLSQKAQAQIAQTLYKKWSAWDRQEQINNLLASCGDHPEILMAILHNILYDTARYSAHHAHLAKALAEHIPSEMLESALQNSPHPIYHALEAMFRSAEQYDSESVESLVDKVHGFFADNLDMHTMKDIPLASNLLIASATGNIQALAELVQDKTQLLVTPNRQVSCMHLAVALDRDECLKTLCIRHPELINTPRNQNATPLHDALMMGRPNLVQLLLDNGADITLCAGSIRQYSVDQIIGFHEEDENIEMANTLRNILENHQEKQNKSKPRRK